MGGSYSAPPKKSTALYNAFEKTLPSMENKVVLITGCTSGTGFIAACAMAKKGAHVVMLNRRSERSEAAYKKVLESAPGAKVTQIDCDLMLFDSVRAAAAAVKERFPEGVDVLCNNAGVMALEDQATKDGYDVQMQTNYLSHFLLTRELLPLLAAAADRAGEARIVSHTSSSRKVPSTAFDAKYVGKNGGNLGGNSASILFGGRRQRYHQSKLATALFSLELDERLAAKGSKIMSLCAAPGLAATSLQVKTQAAGGMGSACFTNLLMKLSQSAEDGTMPLLTCMAAPAVRSGEFYEPLSGGGLWGPAGKKALEPLCTDPKARARLWEASEAAVGKFDV